MTSDDTLAVNGGRPTRTAPFPSVSNASGRTLGSEEIAALQDVITSGGLSRIGGTQVPAFEQEFAEYMGVGHAVASTSGTAAIHLAVAAIDPEPGDEIVVPPITDFGTIIPVLAQNAVPVFADVDPVTGCVTAETVAKVLSERTRAVIVVHLFGGPAPVEDIIRLCRPRGIAVIEDCAQAYHTVPVGDNTFAGTRGDIGCFSLQQSKHITTGDGGLTITRDADLARRMELFADKGWPREGVRTHLFLGMNYRMTELQGAVGRAQLRKLRGVVDSRRDIAASIVDALSDVPGLSLADDVGRHSYWLFPLVIDPSALGLSSQDYAKALRAEGIPVIAGYVDRPVYLLPALVERRTYGTSGFPFTAPPARMEFTYRAGDCPVAERLINETLLVMSINERYTETDVQDIIAAFSKVNRQIHA